MPPTCNYCGKIRHREEECRNRRSELASKSRQLTNYAANAEYTDYGGLFVMRHRANSLMASNSTNSASTSNSKHGWFVDSGASHHITSHQEWFRDIRTPDRPGYIEIGDDTPHPIRERWLANLHQECLARAHTRCRSSGCMLVPWPSARHSACSVC